MWDNDDNDYEYEDQYIDEESETDEVEYEDSVADSLYDTDPDSLTPEEELFLDNALVRLDQARLYEMLITHDLFEDVDVNEISLKAVKKEIKDFIIGRLNFLLGIKSDGNNGVRSAFNSKEIEVLKDLAYRASKGATQDQEPEIKSSQPHVPKQAVVAEKKGDTITPITQRRLERAQQTQKTRQEQMQRPIPVKKKTLAVKEQILANKKSPVLKKKLRRSDSILTNEDLPPAEKRIEEMTETELIEHTKKTEAVYKGRVAVPKNRMPFPTSDQVTMNYMTILGDPNNMAAAISRGIGAKVIENLDD